MFYFEVQFVLSWALKGALSQMYGCFTMSQMADIVISIVIVDYLRSKYFKQVLKEIKAQKHLEYAIICQLSSF